MASVITDTIEYPSSDGQPMAETGIHVQAIILLHQALEDFFRDRPDVFIASDMFWYWKEGDTAVCVAPDVMVVPGVGNHDRRSFLSWQENGSIPAIVFEMASAGTWKDDEEGKYHRYEQLGVREYVLFDPEAMHLSSPLKAYRLHDGAYRRIRSSNGEVESELGFRMRAEGKILRLIDSKTGNLILTRSEAIQLARADAEIAKATAADARAKVASAEAKALAAAELAAVEKAAAEAEKARADALAAEVERLKSLLQQQSPPTGTNP